MTLDVAAGTVEVFVEHRGETSCPKCGKPCAGYDARRRRWRHLDTCQFQTYLTADVPRVECAEHGVSQSATPWAEPGSRFTALFERVVIDWLKEAVEAVAMDMWRPYMDAAARWLPNARVCFDRFHVARHLGEAVNAVRKQEHKRLRAEGGGTLTGTKYLWLENPASMRLEPMVRAARMIRTHLRGLQIAGS